MPRSALMRESITITRVTGEDVNGHAVTASVTVIGAYFELTDAERRFDVGNTPARDGLAVLGPDGYLSTWTVEPGDKLTARGKTLSVLSVAAMNNPRTGTLSHVEVGCG